MDIATQIGSPPVHDGDHVHHDGLIASEFLLAALLIEGTGQGVEALTHLSRGAVNSQTLLAQIGVDPQRLRLPPPAPAPATCDAADAVPAFPFDVAALPDVATMPPAPTATSNWLVPHRLLVGEKPRRADLPLLAAAGIDTLVCLIGEYRTVRPYLDELGLPASAADSAAAAARGTAAARGAAPGGGAAPAVLFFPVLDFEAAPAAAHAPLVRALAGRLAAGGRLLIHCRGGHGRTGMVAIPLLCALYRAGWAAARDHAERCAAAHRRSDGGRRAAMPESREQEDAGRRTCELLRLGPA